VIPWEAKDKKLLDSRNAHSAGYGSLARWLEKAEALWEKYGRKKISLYERLDRFHELSRQFPIPELRVVYAASATIAAAALLNDDRAVVEYVLYWSEAANEREACYLLAILNSKPLVAKIESLQPRGHGGRDTSTSYWPTRSLRLNQAIQIIRNC
jgi:hypothetical protein